MARPFLKASLQPLTGVIRVHLAKACGTKLWREYASYSWACTVQLIGDTAFLHGVDRKPTIDEWKAIGREMDKRGIKTVEFDRVTGGKIRHKVLDVKRFV